MIAHLWSGNEGDASYLALVRRREPICVGLLQTELVNDLPNCAA